MAFLKNGLGEESGEKEYPSPFESLLRIGTIVIGACSSKKPDFGDRYAPRKVESAKTPVQITLYSVREQNRNQQGRLQERINQTPDKESLKSSLRLT